MPPVLVIDDDPVIRKLLRLVCERNGFAAEEAADGAEALEKVSATDYDVVLVDLMMPKANGYEVVERLRARERPPTILVITAMSESHLGDIGGGIVHTIIRKPFDIEVVGKLITDAARAVAPATAIHLRPC